MTNPSWRQGPPRTILLATDLSSRCDRAVQRGLQLAKLWNSRLIILNVIEPVHTTDRNEMGISRVGGARRIPAGSPRISFDASSAKVSKALKSGLSKVSLWRRSRKRPANSVRT